MVISLTFLTDVKCEVSEGPIKDDEDFGGLCVDAIGNGFRCRLLGGNLRSNLPAVLIVYSVEGVLSHGEHGALDQV